MKTEHYLLIGGGILAATLIKLPNGKSLLENLGSQLGAGVGAAIPAAVFSAGGAFVDTSYKTGFEWGVSTSDVLKPAAQKAAETQGIALEQAQPTLAQWETQYQKTINHYADVPIISDIGNIWHHTLTGENWW